MHIEFIDLKHRNTQLYKKALTFYSNELLGNRMSKNIGVSLQHDKDLWKQGVAAFCEWEYEHVRPRDFIITIDACEEIPDEEILQCLAHESIHIKQYVREEYKERYNKGFPRQLNVYWKGENVIPDLGGQGLDKDKPWEIEAYGMETELYEKFMEYHNAGRD